MKSWFAALQRVGQSLMLPVSVLPAAGLLVALGRALQHPAPAFSSLLISGGISIFDFLPLIFAVGVAIGFTNLAGVAGLSAVVGYVTLIKTLGQMTKILHLPSAIDTGVFGGIAIGLLASSLYKRFFQAQLHPIFGFFSGKRLVPILTVGASLALGLALGFIWPPIQGRIQAFGQAVASSEWGPAFYAAGKRLLIPVGLHHVYYPPFLFEFGKFVTSSGEVVRGDSPRYFAGDPTAGRFMAAEFPLMLFGLPAAALAIALRAKPRHRKAVAGAMFTAALTSIITGITEPIEFTFIFVAPLLYVIHVLLAFCSGFLTSYFNIHLGYTFSASAIDYILGFFNSKNSIYLFLVVGPAMAAAYFLIFYWLIGKFDFKTPGRTDEGIEEAEPTHPIGKLSEKAKKVLSAIGGPSNILAISACITRLRLSARDSSRVDEKRLKKLGAVGILNAGGGQFQIVFGVESENLLEQMRQIMKGSLPGNAVYSPFSGDIIPLEKVPDKTFAQKLVGDGIAFLPSEGILHSPCDGTIETLFHTGHAVGIKSDEGAEILIHIGIDTVQMRGRGFKPLVKEGDHVRAKDKLVEFDLELVQKEAPSLASPIVITNRDLFQIRDINQKNRASPNDVIFRIERRR